MKDMVRFFERLSQKCPLTNIIWPAQIFKTFAVD